MERNILICCTGSVATIKLPELIESFKKEISEINLKFNIKVIPSECAKHFIKKDEIPNVEIHTNEDEWKLWQNRGDPVLHINLTKWADILLIAPLDANTLAKISNGICDNLLLCTVRAWNLEKPLFYCPAMNTFMWNHPVTKEHVDRLNKWGYIEIPCISKTLMCGDTGLGAMASVDTIKKTIIEYISKSLKETK